MDTIISTNNLGGNTEIRSQFRQLLLKSFVVLPGIVSTFLGLLFMYLGEPFWEALHITFGFAILSGFLGLGYCIGAAQISKSIVFGMASGISISAFSSIILGVLFDLEKGLGGGLQNSLLGSLLVCAVGSMAGGVVIGVGAGASGGDPLKLSKGILFPLLISILGSLVSGQNSLIMSVIIGAVSGISTTIGLRFNYWRPVLMYPLLEIWNLLIYLVDRQRVSSRSSLLWWNAAFWDEWQRIPLWGLDRHLTLVLRRNSLEGQAARNYLSKSNQQWALK